MPISVTKRAFAYKVEIFIGGDHNKALDICERVCTNVGLCVTVEPVTYCYTGGRCAGVRVGLINYARFPSIDRIIWNRAEDLAMILLDELGQGSYTIQDSEISEFYSRRVEDGCDG